MSEAHREITGEGCVNLIEITVIDNVPNDIMYIIWLTRVIRHNVK